MKNLLVNIIATGSSGNCYVINYNNKLLLLDAGISFKQIKNNVDLSKLEACLITHEHIDHIRGLKLLLKYGITCFMSKGTTYKFDDADENIRIIKHNNKFNTSEWTITPFAVIHDAIEPLNYVLSNNEYKILYITDTSFVNYNFTQLTHILIECNYDAKLLKKNYNNGDLHDKQFSRIIKYHFEIKAVKSFLSSIDLTLVQDIYLIHISKNNGDAMKFKKEIEKSTGKNVYVGE